MSADLTPQGAAAVRLAATVVQLKAERDRARGIAVALEQRLAALESALRRTEANFIAAVNGRPVRDMAENLGENRAALEGNQ